MNEEINKFKFKPELDLEIEVISLSNLVKESKEHLIRPHRTNFYHIFLFDNCEPIHLIDCEPIKVNPSSLLFIDKDRVHQFDQSLNYDGYLLIFTEDFFCRNDNDINFLRSSILFNDLLDLPTIKLQPIEYNLFKNIFANINEEIALPADSFKQLILKNLLHNLLLMAEREKKKQGGVNLKKGVELELILQFRALLEKNYKLLKNVQEYTKLIFVSEKRLGQATTQILGKTPKEMINERILLEAKRLLIHTNMTIKEIGIDIGFEDSAYFVRFFKKNTSTTPLEFKTAYLKK